MQVEHLEIDNTRIMVSPAEIISLLGDEQGEIDSHTMELTNKYLVECKEIMSPMCGYVLFDADGLELKEAIEINGTRFHIGKILKRMLRNSERYAFFAVTAGPEPESLSKSLFEKSHFLEGYIVDLIGSGIVDSVADQMHRFITNHAATQGMKATNRYSPGYCSWDVAEQQKLFGLLPESCCDISLSDSSLMSPIKSISGVIGLGPDVKFQDYTCEICSMKDCQYRKAMN